MHITSQPAILYFGTPVVLVSTVNENETYNLAPISSVFWLGWRCVIGMGAASKTVENLRRTKQCVLNLPSVNEVAAVDRLALTTGSDPVPEPKRRRGYRTEKDKFALAGFTPRLSDQVVPPRVEECSVQLEAEMVVIHQVAEEDEKSRGRIVTIELKIVRVHLDETILVEGDPDRIDPDKWRPLMMSFQKFYGLGEQVHASTLSQIPEHLYK